jgi:hypothetical protein
LKRIDDTLLLEDNIAQFAISTFKERELGFDSFACVVVHGADSFTSLTSVTLTVTTGIFLLSLHSWENLGAVPADTASLSGMSSQCLFSLQAQQVSMATDMEPSLRSIATAGRSVPSAMTRVSPIRVDSPSIKRKRRVLLPLSLLVGTMKKWSAN